MKAIFILFVFLISWPVLSQEVPEGFMGLDKQTLANLDKEALAKFMKDTKHDRELSEGECKVKEQLNRYLLQQTWFFDEDKTGFGMIFGYYGFSNSSDTIWTQASFCIDGKSIIATYYYYEPDYYEPDASVNREYIRAETNSTLRTLPNIEMVVETLTENRLVFWLPASKEKLSLYR